MMSAQLILKLLIWVTDETATQLIVELPGRPIILLVVETRTFSFAATAIIGKPWVLIVC
jgi:hypothetical protein